jgi:lipid A disaccharide synthetase
VPELLQGKARPDLITAALMPLLQEGGERNTTLDEFDRIHRQLRLGYSDRAAEAIAALVAEKRR